MVIGHDEFYSILRKRALLYLRQEKNMLVFYDMFYDEYLRVAAIQKTKESKKSKVVYLFAKELRPCSSME